jgi:hypothetical protein
MSVISSSDHWLFVSSSGGLTAGRVSPDTALFPYLPVDRIHDGAAHTGSKTILRVRTGADSRVWEPFNREHDGRYRLGRNLYKNVLGDKVCFEEVNHDLRLAYRYTWMTSAAYGFVRQSELVNFATGEATVELLDGLQNILPAGTPRVTQASASNLVDAYKWTELCERTGLGIYALYAGISDRAEPYESLRANVVFSLGLDHSSVLISSAQLDDFRRGRGVRQQARERGVRGAYFVHASLRVPPGAVRRWTLVADVEQTQCQVVERLRQLEDPPAVAAALARSVDEGSDELARLVGAADGFQVTAEENVPVPLPERNREACSADWRTSTVTGMEVFSPKFAPLMETSEIWLAVTPEVR